MLKIKCFEYGPWFTPQPEKFFLNRGSNMSLQFAHLCKYNLTRFLNFVGGLVGFDALPVQPLPSSHSRSPVLNLITALHPKSSGPSVKVDCSWAPLKAVMRCDWRMQWSAGLAAFAWSRWRMTFESPTIERTSDMIKLVLLKREQGNLWAVGMSK
jgi:hypothetical protein